MLRVEGCWLRQFGWAFVCLVVLGLATRTARGETNVLFVGNSFTHGASEPVYSFNKSAIKDANGTGQGGVAGIFKKLCDNAGFPSSVTIETVSAQTLMFHAKQKSGVLNSRRDDVVVLQEVSTGPLPAEHGGRPEQFDTGAHELQSLFRANNPAAKIILYETWTSPTGVRNQHYKDLGSMQTDLKKACEKVAKELDCQVAPVGDAFLHAVETGVADPENRANTGKLQLWGSDNRHASKYGSYLSACVIFSTVSGRDPESLKSGPGTAADGLGIAPKDASSLQRIAHEVTQVPAH
jgi:hypothetical protein